MYIVQNDYLIIYKQTIPIIFFSHWYLTAMCCILQANGRNENDIRNQNWLKKFNSCHFALKLFNCFLRTRNVFFSLWICTMKYAFLSINECSCGRRRIWCNQYVFPLLKCWNWLLWSKFQSTWRDEDVPAYTTRYIYDYQSNHQLSKNNQVSPQSKYLRLGSSNQQQNNWARYHSRSIAYRHDIVFFRHVNSALSLSLFFSNSGRKVNTKKRQRQSDIDNNNSREKGKTRSTQKRVWIKCRYFCRLNWEVHF